MPNGFSLSCDLVIECPLCSKPGHNLRGCPLKSILLPLEHSTVGSCVLFNHSDLLNIQLLQFWTSLFFKRTFDLCAHVPRQVLHHQTYVAPSPLYTDTICIRDTTQDPNDNLWQQKGQRRAFIAYSSMTLVLPVIPSRSQCQFCLLGSKKLC